MTEDQSDKDDESYGEHLFRYTFDEGRQEPRFLIFRVTTHILTSWFPLTHHAANAIRDYEYLTRLTPITGSQARRGRLDLERVFGDESYQFIDEGTGYRRFDDPSLLPTDNLREVLKRRLPRSMTYTSYDIRNRTEEYFNNEPPEQVSPLVDRLARFLVAFLGGAMLVVPMMVMRLPEVTVVKSLVTASNTDTMVATATYAAVLVVFVGVSG
ncbi:unnamed protein product [Fusarium graminearum]|uniref:Chromosome 4, complete genome n=1 Tax=Gibberella zeae (strain ATCC MYA-4620 / CBS 123657 / FGSC 9075 / NRRL 31084 / PH-1) TaxID=229533 RepID=I1RXV0_GIBZE|nr:hypothetical protein FGSG_09176 [Fusarium graminearum PH-1]ESU15712.1 hypothetical protein FGSG_09176 [Fusarium graminearum PH-1]EYB26825.1 hypothetical protein FG05_09176 [Fusarium graminearum]CEF85502.1 unnamed protein product [Fusarium graminearum]CZS74780.1 unnamed protein product [Fusarium graminearum]|eukprot:XP_011328604.1 hypothetical protein FGSG_09176 [Fusarium graminearum PH-1]